MSTSSATKPTIAIVYYSMYGHIGAMAKAIAKGVEASGAEAKLYQVPETLSEDVLAKMHAPPKDAEVPVATHDDLVAADGIIFGIPTRFGMMAAQMKTFFDTTGGLWMGGKLVGKTVGFFVSTGTQGGGQETTIMTALTLAVHHGMVYVPMGYTNPKTTSMDEMHGGGPWGPGCFAGPDGSRAASELELEIATHYGSHHAGVAAALKAGRAALA
jgi:NAD(P)H dehydrogenase (quinone)